MSAPTQVPASFAGLDLAGEVAAHEPNEREPWESPEGIDVLPVY